VFLTGRFGVYLLVAEIKGVDLLKKKGVDAS